MTFYFGKIFRLKGGCNPRDPPPRSANDINGSGFWVAKHFYLSLFSKLAGGWFFPRHEDVKGPGFVLYWEFYVALTLFFSHIAIWNRRYPISEITAARPGNKPGPITPQAKSVTTSPSPLQQRD